MQYNTSVYMAGSLYSDSE